MTPAENKILVQRYYEEVLNQRQPAVIDELFAPHFMSYPKTNLAAYKQAVLTSLTAFPDIHVTIEDQIAEDDRVATRWSAKATHHGPFGAIPPTGKTIQVTAMHFHRLAQGKIIEHWEQFDLLSALQQMGILPPLNVSPT